MIVREVDTTSRREVRAFIDLPFLIYKNCPLWVPSLRRDAFSQLDPHKNPFFQSSEAAFLMVFDDNENALGRIAVLNNRPYNAHNEIATAFFYLFEVMDDFHAAEALFESAFHWARERGLTNVFGPKGFAALNGLGMLSRGFEHRPAFGIPYNHPYYPEYLRRLGFKKEREVLSGYLNSDLEIPEKIQIIAEKVQKRWGVKAERFESRRDLRKMIPHLKDLYNGSLGGTSGNAPLTDDDVNAMAQQIIWFTDPRLIKVLMKGEKAVGFLLAYPDISAALQKSKGRLFPFGWLHVLFELRKTDWVNINGAGIIEEYRGLGGTAVLFNEMGKSIKESRYQHADLVQIGLENTKMQLELSSFGIDFYKSHSMYSIDI